MQPLATLVCGNAKDTGSPSEVTSHLTSVPDRLLVRARALRIAADPVDLALFGPFLGRAHRGGRDDGYVHASRECTGG
jgi:hypothetical protein